MVRVAWRYARLDRTGNADAICELIWIVRERERCRSGDPNATPSTFGI